MSDKPVRENIRQHQALLAYSSMPDPSLQKLHQTWEKHVPKMNKFFPPEIKKPSLRTLKEWCRKYQWVARAEAIHQAAKEEAINKAVEQLTMSKVEILTITRALMIKYGQQLRDNTQGRITLLDFEKAWKIQRIELNLPSEIGQEELTVKDPYEGVSDEELLAKLEMFTAKYKEKISRQQGFAIP